MSRPPKKGEVGQAHTVVTKLRRISSDLAALEASLAVAIRACEAGQDLFNRASAAADLLRLTNAADAPAFAALIELVDQIRGTR